MSLGLPTGPAAPAPGADPAGCAAAGVTEASEEQDAEEQDDEDPFDFVGCEEVRYTADEEISRTPLQVTPEKIMRLNN